MDDKIYIPASRAVYDAILRLSCGDIDPVDVADAALRDRLAALERELGAWTEALSEPEPGGEPGRRRIIRSQAAPPPPAGADATFPPAPRAGLHHCEEAAEGDLIWPPLALPEGTRLRIRGEGGDIIGTVAGGAVSDGRQRFKLQVWHARNTTGGRGNAWWDVEILPVGDSRWIAANEARRRIKRAGGRAAVGI